MKKIEEIQKELDTHRRQLKFSQEKKFNNFKEVVDFATLANYTIDNSTKYGSGGFHCRQSAQRGASDIYRLCKTYFPNIKLEQVLKYLNTNTFSKNYCFTTNQDVFMKRPGSHQENKGTIRVRLKNFKSVRAKIED